MLKHLLDTIKNIKNANKNHQKYLETNHLLRHFETQFAPGHFYSPYPDLQEMEKRKNNIFNRTKKQIPGIDIQEKQQLDLLNRIASHYDNLPYHNNKIQKNYAYYLDHHAFAHTDSTILFCMLNELRPKRVIEIGSGYSSALMLDYKKYIDKNLEITFIEPYPQLLKRLVSKIHPRTSYNLIAEPLWRVDKKIFKKLKSGDILFIDSTHVSKAGSDVNEIFFEILPVINKGVVIHIHDVFYPFEYPIEWIKETRAWNEDYLLRAFLYNNNEYKIILFNHFLNIHHSKLIHRLLPLTKHNDGGSLWLKKVA